MRVDSINDLPPALRQQAVDQLLKQQTQNTEDDRNIGKAKPSKYNNNPADRNGIKFDSKKEAARFDYLVMLQKAGAIRELKLQCDFTLWEAFTKTDGERVRAMRYRADFCYERKTDPGVNGNSYWVRVVEDVKSRATRTKDYIIKKKAMENILGISIQEV